MTDTARLRALWPKNMPKVHVFYDEGIVTSTVHTEDDEIFCECESVEDAELIAEAVNALRGLLAENAAYSARLDELLAMASRIANDVGCGSYPLETSAAVTAMIAETERLRAALEKCRDISDHNGISNKCPDHIKESLNAIGDTAREALNANAKG